MDCEGLSRQWEGSCELRELARKHSRLLVYPETAKFCEATRENCKSNATLLKPLLQRLHETPKWALPHLEPLQREVTLLLDKLGTNPGEKFAYKTSVEVKKLLSFLKRRVTRKEVTKDMGSTQ